MISLLYRRLRKAGVLSSNLSGIISVHRCEKAHNEMRSFAAIVNQKSLLTVASTQARVNQRESSNHFKHVNVEFIHGLHVCGISGIIIKMDISKEIKTESENPEEKYVIINSVLEILNSNNLLSLSTINEKNNHPDICSAYYVFDKDLNLYIWTNPNSKHASNIEKNLST